MNTNSRVLLNAAAASTTAVGNIQGAREVQVIVSMAAFTGSIKFAVARGEKIVAAFDGTRVMNDEPDFASAASETNQYALAEVYDVADSSAVYLGAAGVTASAETSVRTFWVNVPAGMRFLGLILTRSAGALSATLVTAE